MAAAMLLFPRFVPSPPSPSPSPPPYLSISVPHHVLFFRLYPILATTRTTANPNHCARTVRFPNIHCCSSDSATTTTSTSTVSPPPSDSTPPPEGTTTTSLPPVKKKRNRYRKQYPGEKEGITEEMRFIAMKLRNNKGGRRYDSDGSDDDGDGTDSVDDKDSGEEEMEGTGTWQPSMEGFVKYLVDSKLVFSTIERIVDESQDVSYTYFRKTGLERSENNMKDLEWLGQQNVQIPYFRGPCDVVKVCNFLLATDTYFRKTGLERSENIMKDLEWLGQQNVQIPEPSTPGKTYVEYLEGLAEKRVPLFLSHFYNIYFSHIAGGQVIAKQEVSSMLLEKLIAAGIGDRPVVFVTHSMGGLVVKQILYQAVAENRDNLVRNTVGVVFYSCPHFGSKLADMPWRIGFVFRPAPTIGELRSGSTRLVELNDFVRHLHKKGSLDVLSFCETKVTPLVEGYGGWAFRMEIVPIESAYPGFGELVVLESTDHVNSCKPISKSDPSYEETLNFLHKLRVAHT